MALRNFILCLLATLPGAAAGQLLIAPPPPAHMMEEAERLCDSLPLLPAEGIWVFPDDHVTVLVSRSSAAPDPLPKFKITVVDSEDIGLEPGDTLGFIQATPQTSIYKLTFTCAAGKKHLEKPFECDVKLDADKGIFLIPARKKPLRIRLSFNPSSLLPGFLRLFRLAASQNADPSIPARAMMKIYPSYDGNGSFRTQPRYL